MLGIIAKTLFVTIIILGGFLFLGLIILILKIIKIVDGDYFRKLMVRGILVVFLLLLMVFPLTILIISYSFGTSFEDHYNVERGTFLFYTVIDSRVKEFPLIDPIDKPIYNHIGGDSPNIAGGCEIEYATDRKLSEALPIIKNYVRTIGFTIEESNETRCDWRRHRGSNCKVIFSGQNGDECIDIVFTDEQNGFLSIKAVIIM